MALGNASVAYQLTENWMPQMCSTLGSRWKLALPKGAYRIGPTCYRGAIGAHYRCSDSTALSGEARLPANLLFCHCCKSTIGTSQSAQDSGLNGACHALRCTKANKISMIVISTWA